MLECNRILSQLYLPQAQKKVIIAKAGYRLLLYFVVVISYRLQSVNYEFEG
jgi:hypothetical protein